MSDDRTPMTEHLRVDHGWSKKKVERYGKKLDDAHVDAHDGDIRWGSIGPDDRPHYHPTGHLSPIQTTDVTYE